MQSLRITYHTYQADAYQKKPILPNSTKTIKAIKQADEQVLRIQNSNDFSNLEEAIFYKEKFEALHEVTRNYEAKKMPKDMYLDQVRALLGRDFNGVSVTQSKMVETRRQKQPLTVPGVSGYRSKTKSPLKQFFDELEMKNSGNKVVFSSLLSREQTPLKYGLRTGVRSRPLTNNNNMNQAQVRRLRQQNDRLRSQLDGDRSVHSNEDRLRQLRSQISQLSQQNRRLKVQASSGTRSDYLVQQQYDPYNIKTRENNILRINSRNLSMSEKTSQYGEEFRYAKGSRIYYDNQGDLARSQFTHNPMQYSAKKLYPTQDKLTPSQDKLNLPQNKLYPYQDKPNVYQESDLLNSSHSTIQTQFLNLDQSQLQDQQKNHICREKIAFFKNSMVLYKSQDFDIAFKRSDLNTQMDRLRIIVYINNKSPSKLDCKIEYDYEREDFDLVVRKKLQRVEGRGQGREELQLTLRNATDLGSLIIAKVLVGSVLKKILIPALFINFDTGYKHQFQNIGYVQRNLTQPLTIRPMGQFSSYQKTSNILQLTRDYDTGRYPVAKLYGKSKVTKGIVKLTWKNDKLRIETCEEWRTLMGYLFLNAEETIAY